MHVLDFCLCCHWILNRANLLLTFVIRVITLLACMCNADKRHLRHEAFLFCFIVWALLHLRTRRNSASFLPVTAFLETHFLLDEGFYAENCRNRMGNSPVCYCLERKPPSSILLVHFHCCPSYIMRKSFEKCLANSLSITSIHWVVS